VRALDCCAGAGGLSLGLQRAGFDVHGVELDVVACETHRSMVGPCDNVSLWDYESLERFELVAGGIPCQSHSTAGKRGGTCDPRGQLYIPFLRIAQQAQARAVLIENVRGMLTSPSATHGTALHEVVAAVRAAGFEHAVHNVLNAADYGVPQCRHRLFVVGFRSADDARRFEWPRQTHSRDGGGLFGLRRWVSVREALGLGGGSMVRDAGAGAEREPRSLDELSYTIRAGASGRAPGGVRLLDQPAHTVSTGGVDTGGAEPFANATYRKRLSAELSALDQPAPCVTATEHKSANRFGSKGATTGPRRCGDQLNPLLTELAAAGVLDRPSTAVDTTDRLSAAGHHKTNKHGAVRLTVEQLAALQAFPRDFVFSGTKTQQHRQVGNAVPPPLAEAVGRSIRYALEPDEVTP
jgi:DNA (cytosine-5)-methyltransferase 1